MPQSISELLLWDIVCRISIYIKQSSPKNEVSTWEIPHFTASIPSSRPPPQPTVDPFSHLVKSYIYLSISMTREFFHVLLKLIWFFMFQPSFFVSDRNGRDNTFLITTKHCIYSHVQNQRTSILWGNQVGIRVCARNWKLRYCESLFHALFLTNDFFLHSFLPDCLSMAVHAQWKECRFKD